MGKVEWTKAQEEAINSSSKSLIVSAAAGSGKTAVLVERIINKISSEKSAAKIDRLLVVTFTRAAANEMRERIGRALDEKIRENPTDKNLLRQKIMLPLADICTIDQFFGNIVKENFSKLSITPDFRILDDSESKLISNEAVNEVLEEYYENADENFNRLLEITGCDKNDDTLADAVKLFAKNSDAYPEPEKWLDDINKVYSEKKRPQDTQFGEIILNQISDCAEYAKILLDRAINYACDTQGLEKVYIVLKNDEEKINSIIEKCKTREWDSLKVLLETLSFERFPTVKDEYKSCPEKLFSKKYRDKMKSVIDTVRDIMSASEAEYCEDIELLNPVVAKFTEVVLEYKKRFYQKKAEENSYDFIDIVHLALKLLVCDGKPTQSALELRKKYDEILIDEYQDTNEAQDKIFSFLSDDEKNMFLVGDVKQSIYRFRLAMPQVFLGRISKWRDKNCGYADYLSLDSNFRSRPEILNAVNYIFERVMSAQAGEIEYDDTQSLKPGADCYSQSDKKCVEFLMLDGACVNDPEYTEVQMIADKIEELLKGSGVYDKNTKTMRAAQYKDICVLLRQRKLGPAILKELKKREIPSYFEEDSGFFDNPEISVMLSLLSVINNPLQDIHLVSVLLSPIFGFSADEISLLRINSRDSELYYAVKKSDSEKCRYFIEKYNEYRSLSCVESVHELLRTIYEDSGYISIVTALNNGEIKKLNLLLLLEYASQYESFGKSGLSGFMRYIDRMRKNGSDFKPAGTVSEYADVVKIMTVHKSKGLEFPIVFLSDCSRSLRDKSKSLIIHEKIGMGIKINDKKTFRKYSTLPYEAAKILNKKSECSEELRVLYVALTRARERLIITSEVSDVNKTVENASADCLLTPLNPVAVINSRNFTDILLRAFLSHPNAGALRDCCNYDGVVEKSSDFDLSVEIIRENAEKSAAVDTQSDMITAPVDGELLKRIKEKTGYKYKYGALSNCASKLAASAFNKLENNMQYFANDVPKFMQSGNMTSAQKGTAVHKFMETCDFKRAHDDIEAERERLVSLSMLSRQQAESLELNVISRFFESGLYKRIAAADRVVREQKFRISVPVNKAFGELEEDFENENIIVQGIIDCAFFENGKAVILDYKTDRVSDSNELVKMYHRQLEIYKTAAEQIFSCEVGEVLLYSFALGEEKQINL